MSELDLRRLRNFVVVAEEQHFGRAAERLHLAQPALSVAIRKLETELDLVLLERSTRRVELTSAGRAFLQEAKQILAQSRQAIDIARRIQSGAQGSLRVGFSQTILPRYLTVVLREFCRLFPGVGLSLFEQPVGVPFYALDGRVDVAMAFAHTLEPRGLTVNMIGRERIVAILPPGHALAAMDEIPMGVLAGESFVTLHRNVAARFYDAFIGLFSTRGLTVKVVHEVGEAPTLSALIIAGLGLAIGPESWALSSAGTAEIRPVVDVRSTMDIVIAHPSTQETPIIREFIAVAKSALPPTVVDGHPFVASLSA